MVFPVKIANQVNLERLVSNVMLESLLLAQKNRALLVVAEDVEGDALTMLVLNKHHAGLKVNVLFSYSFDVYSSPLQNFYIFISCLEVILHRILACDECIVCFGSPEVTEARRKI